VFGPNVVGGTNSNDFNISVIDDPQSYAALLKPVDPATIGFFIDEGYEQARVFLLFLSRIQVYDSHGKNIIKIYDFEHKRLIDADLSNDPLTFYKGELVFDHDYLNFYKVVKEYLDQGLSVKVDPTYVPQIGKSGTAMFCFDRSLIDRDTQPTLAQDPTKLRYPCPRELPPPSKDATKSSEIPVSVSKISGPNSLQLNISVSTQENPKQLKPNFTFNDQEGKLVQVQTRSVFGAYRFLGEMLRLVDSLSSESEALKMTDIFTRTPPTDFLYLTHESVNCWSSVVYEGTEWCVPATALGTKRLFAILHQLFELYTTPSNQPATPTVRVTPG
jgi:hypothetical protein